MLTQGFLPAKGVGGSSFPPSLLFPWFNSAVAAMPGWGNARLLGQASSLCGVAWRGEGFAAAECFREFCSRRESSVSLETGWTHHCPAILLFASCLSVCPTSPKQLQHHGFGFSAGFWAVGALLGSVKPPPLPLFINIRAKYRLFKLAVAVQILIAGFYFQDQRSGTEGSRVFLGEFSIYGDRAAHCLAKTWLGRGNKKEKKRKRVCSSSPSTVVTPALPRVCARAFSSPRDRGCRVA